MSKLTLKSNYAVEAKHEPYFTGKCVQVTNDGNSLVCECEDSVAVVTLATGQVSGKISCEEDVVTCISLAPDNSSLIVALRSTSIQQYNWPVLELQRSFRSYHRGPVTVMKWDASSTLLITGAADSSARVWDLQQKYCTHSLKGASGVFGTVMFDPDLVQRPRVYGSAGNVIHIWTLSAGSSELLTSLRGHHSAVTSLEMTIDCHHLVSCGLDRVIILWDLKTFENKRVVPVLESLSSILLQPCNKVFPGGQIDDGHIYSLCVGDKGIPSVWQVDTGRQVWKASAPLLPVPSEDSASLINQLAYSPALDSVIYTTYDHSVLFANVSTLTVWKQLAGYNDKILDVIFAGHGDTHLVVAANSAQLCIYSVKDFSCRLIQGHSANIFALSRHPTQHELFASSSHDKTARLWCLESDGTAVCLAVAVGHTLSVGCLVLSQGFMVTGSHDMCLKRWNTTSVKPRTKTDAVESLPSTHTEKAHEKDINSLCVSVNNKLIASGSQDKTAKVWDSSNLSLLGILRGHRRGIWCVQFSPVEELLATGSADATIKIWTLSDFTNVSTLEGHGVSVMKLSWVSQGQQLISIGSDGLMKLWTVKTRQCLQTCDEHNNRLWALAVSSDESKLVTGGEDATLIDWKDVTQEEKEKEVEEAARLAAEEQTLLNLIQDKKWAKALGIAVRLNQPFRGLKIIKELLSEGHETLPKVLGSMRHDQLVSLLHFASQWNTKTKNSYEAQCILHTVLATHSPEDMEVFRDWKKLLEGLLPYTERHFRRLSALYQSASILNYMSSSLSIGGARSVMQPEAQDNLQLLRSISSSSPIKCKEENIYSDKESEDEDPSIKAAVKDSIMVVDSQDEVPEAEENNGERANKMEYSVESDEGIERDSDMHGIPVRSGDDLDANFMMEKIIVESSDDDTGEREVPRAKELKVKSYSSDQLELKPSNKVKRKKGGKTKNRHNK
ncbi:Transducin (beta)-like 3 [Halocaridina rubra]|uniref:Transducin (Beta)-like 3 n=1 Tax=Halocaridina rubra TaxID=373956 RepID=A0AAN8X4I3_HALRR